MLKCLKDFNLDSTLPRTTESPVCKDGTNGRYSLRVFPKAMDVNPWCRGLQTAGICGIFEN
jgi:hypothetical protein